MSDPEVWRGVCFELCEEQFEWCDKAGRLVSSLRPPGIEEPDLVPGLVFSLDDDEIRAVKIENWIKRGNVRVVTAPPAEPEPEVEPEPEPIKRRGKVVEYD